MQKVIQLYGYPEYLTAFEKYVAKTNSPITQRVPYPDHVKFMLLNYGRNRDLHTYSRIVELHFAKTASINAALILYTKSNNLN